MNSSSADDNVRAINALMRNIRIFPDLTGFEWFGSRYSELPDSDERLAAIERRKLLVEAVTDCLYSNYYCTGAAVPCAKYWRYDVRTSHSKFVEEILNADSSRVAWSEMKVLRASESVIVTAYGRVEIYTARSSSMLRTVDGMPIPANNANLPSTVFVGGKSWTLGASPGFIFLFGQREIRVGPAIHRVYLNLRPSGAIEFVAAGTQHLNRRCIPFRLKVLANPLFYSRRLDTAVIYLNLTDPAAREAVSAAYREVAHHARDEHPALTRRIAAGLAIAEDPGDGLSFGTHRCQLLAESFVRAAEREFTAQSDVHQCVVTVFSEHGIDLLQPHRASTSNDAYLFELESLIRPPPQAKASRARLSSKSDNGDSWLAVATEIGRQLVAEAFRENGRCQWVGGAMIPSGALVFRAMPPGLYSGLAGVGHFLAELAVRTKSEQTAATALGALRQAISTSAESPAGLYVGSLGVAIVAARAALNLGDSKLAEQAAAFARRVAAAPFEKNPDLLHGLAGQILGLLVLANILPGEPFELRAIEIGELLVEQADRHQAGWSWPNPIISSSRHLTGLSHGTAGIALALGELGRRTGDQSFLAAVDQAISYEDAAFDELYATWPDYRSLDRRSNESKYLHFWCHGSAGIVVSRLRLAYLVGLDELWQTVAPAVEALRQFVETNLRQPGTSFNLCHGVAGNAEVLLEASRWGQGFASWQKRAAYTAESCWRVGATVHARLGIWPCGPHPDNPSLFVGRAGIGYAYLRLHDPSVPSLLAFHPADWSAQKDERKEEHLPGKDSDHSFV